MAQDRVIIVGRTPAGQPVAVCVDSQGRLCGVNANIQINYTEVTEENPIPVDEIIRAESSWTTLMNNQPFDNITTAANSLTHDITGYGGMWVHIYIDSNNTPTDIRVLAQYSDDGGVTWWDFEEGLWASLMWEDTDTAAGIRKAYLLTCGGQDLVRFRVICTGTTAVNVFICTIRCRSFYGNFGVAHA